MYAMHGSYLTSKTSKGCGVHMNTFDPVLDTVIYASKLMIGFSLGVIVGLLFMSFIRWLLDRYDDRHDF